MSSTTGVPAAATAGRHGLHKRVLDNGLRVVLSPHWPTPRVAVSVHYGVGFRSERPGQEGLAHLFEHLMFRGSENLPDGRFFDGLHLLAGTANGTTHQDYTDYFQVVPAAALEQALFREADRMRAPRFTADQLAIQLAEVGREIGLVRDGRPYGGFPWPLLPGVMYRDFVNAHDGYGDAERLSRTTVEDCERFFDLHYAPSNAVLTVVGPQGPDVLWALVERHFGGIPARPAPRPPMTDEPPPTEDRQEVHPAPGAPRTAVAVGYRLPDPVSGLRDYVAHMVLAELTGRPGTGGERPIAAPVGAGCGFFGPLDAVRPDALVVTSLLPAEVPAADFVRGLTDWWARLGDVDAVAEDVGRAARSLAARHRRDHAELQQRCRALGRLELLFGRAELVEELPSLVERVGPDRVASAATALAGAHRAVLVMEPCRERPRPAPAAASAAEAPAAPGRAGTGPERGTGGACPLPPLGDQVAPALDGVRETALSNGLRVMAAPDRRTGLVELRLRVPLGNEGWRRPREVARMLRAAEEASGARARVARLGGDLRLSTDGQWADAGGWAPASELDGLLRVVADLLDPLSLGDAAVEADARSPRRSAEQRMDEALRLHWLRGSASRGDDAVEAAELHRRVLDPRGAVLVLVGDVEPERAVARAEVALGGWAAHGPRPAGARPDEGVLVVGEPTGGAVHLTLCAAEVSDGSRDPARYLATALFGGHVGSRLAERCRRLGRADLLMHAGRDVVADRARALVRVTVPRPFLAAAVNGVREEVRALVHEPPGPEEVEGARRYCAAQLLSAFDSPALLADALRHTMASGRNLDWVVRRPRLLQAVTGEEVAEAAHDLFGSVTRTVVALGGVERDELERELTPDR